MKPPPLTLSTLKSASARLDSHGLASSSIPSAANLADILASAAPHLEQALSASRNSTLGGVFAVARGVYRALDGEDEDRTTFALTAAREWLAPTRWRVVMTPEARAAIQGVDHGWTMEESLRAIGRVTVDRFTGRQLVRDPNPGDVERAFVASAMSNPLGPDIEELVRDVESLEWLLGTFGIFAFCPILLRDPRLGRSESNRAGLLQVDEAMMADSDVAILISHPPANGLGVIARLAVELQVPTVLLHGDSLTAVLASEGQLSQLDLAALNVLSVMLLDEPNDVLATIDRSIDSPTMLEHLFALLSEGTLRTSEHRDERMARMQQATNVVEHVVNVVRGMSSYERERLPESAISEERWQFLIQHPLNFIGAVGRERAALDQLVPLAVPDLDEHQHVALRTAQRRGGWDDVRSAQLERLVRRQMAREPSLARDALRRDTHDVSYWLVLDEAVRD